MGESGSDAVEPADPMDEVREAASEVIGSLRHLLAAAEKLVADPAAFDRAVAGGRGLVDAFTSGLVDESKSADSDPLTD